MTLAAAATPDTGRARPQGTPLAELSPLSETVASCACVNAGAATSTVRMAAEAAPRAKFASYTRSTPFGGNQTPAGRTERPVCAPDTVTQL